MSNPHGTSTHGASKTLTYARWKSMRQRCNITSATNYKYYGAKGVLVCARWDSFPAFLEDMGECPDKTMTLDRIENSKGYEPGNCQWATQAAQNANRSHCVLLTHNGVTRNLTDWAKNVGLDPGVLTKRILLGWTVDRALTTPLRVLKPRIKITSD